MSPTSVSPTLAVLTLIMMAFAECTGDNASSTRASLTGPAAPVEFDDTTGGIEGSVMDAEQLPIVGAQVGILALE